MKKFHIIPLVICAGLIFQLTASTIVLARQPRIEPENPENSRRSSEFIVSQPIPGNEPTRFYPAVAMAITTVNYEFLVVWENWWSSSYQDIYAQRVSATGELLSYFTIAAGGHSRRFPALVYNPGSGKYLVVYMYDANGDGATWEVWGKFVSRDGSWMGSEFKIFGWPNRGFWEPRVAWDQIRDEYLVVANAVDTTTGLWNDVVCRRVTNDGSTPYPGHSVSVQDQTLQPSAADVAWGYPISDDLGEYLVVWRQKFSGDDWDIWGARVSGLTDAVVDPPGIFKIDSVSKDQNNPAVTATDLGRRYLVVWEQGASTPPTTQWDIYGRELDMSGNPATNSFAIADSTDSEQYPAVAYDWKMGPQRFVVWRRSKSGVGEETWGIFWDRDPTMYLMNEYFQIAPDTAWMPAAVAKAGPTYLTVYGKTVSSVQYIYGRLFWPWAVYLPAIQR